MSERRDATADEQSNSLSDDPVIREAKKRFDRCAEWEGTSRERFLNDIKFRHGDAVNGWQWPNELRRQREVDRRPCLTMNVVRQHNLQIINEARRDKSEIRIIPLRGGATVDGALAQQDLVRHVQWQSDAQAAFIHAQSYQVDGGIGWWRLITDYASDETFDQEIFIQMVDDPLSVYMDPDIQKADGTDAEFAFVFDIVPNDEFNAAYPRLKAEGLGQSPLGVNAVGMSWIQKDHTLIAEYFRKVRKRDWLLSFINPQTGERQKITKSRVPLSVWESAKESKWSKWREVQAETIEWKLLAGERIIDETIWPGKYIPLVRIIGEETKVDGQLDRKGHTRAMLDAQRMFNFNASAQVETVALQGKTPWKSPAAAIESFEDVWDTANTVNHSVLVYNHVDDEGNPIPAPERQEPPQHSPAYEAGMQTAFNQMMMTSGQWQNQMGMMGNERTGKAIAERKEQSDTSTFHFYDNYASGLITTGRMLIDLFPVVYDTKRIKRIAGSDGNEYELEVDPGAKQAYQQIMNHKQEVIRRIFNPNVGEYDIASDVGPATGSKRKQTAEALTLILTQAPALTGIIGDLLLESLDFDKALEAAKRLRRMVPPQAMGQGPTQAEQALQQQLQQMQVALGKTLEQHAKDRLKLAGKDQMRDIDAYKAETDRFKALADSLGLEPEAVRMVINQLVRDSSNISLTPIVNANKDEINNEPSGGEVTAEQPPMPGARKAPDGEWYVLDPTRKSKFLRVGPLAQQRAH